MKKKQTCSRAVIGFWSYIWHCLSDMLLWECFQSTARSPNLNAMCENIFARRLPQRLMNMLECTCKYLVNTGQHALWLCLPFTRHISPHTVRLWLHGGMDVIGPRQNYSSGNVSLTCWISTVEFFPHRHPTDFSLLLCVNLGDNSPPYLKF